MARPLRVEFPGAFYHVMSRSIQKERIFKTNRDRDKFFEFLDTLSDRFSIVIHTYCLMDNHYHLLLETPDANLSAAMQWINVSYAVYFNRAQSRYGHLFQGRYKAILIDADAYLKELSRYIHLNPVRASKVSQPSDYQWSSYGAYVGMQSAPEFLETSLILSQFGDNMKQSKKSYRKFVESIDFSAVKNPGEDSKEGFLLGGTEFVRWVKENYLSNREDDEEIPQLKNLKPKLALKRIIQAVSEEFNCDEDWIIKKGRKRNQAREVAIYLARKLCRDSSKDLGKYFGDVSGALITIKSKDMADRSKRDKELEDRIRRVKDRIFNI